MALKIYINDEVQAFKKRGNNDVLFGVQISPNYKLLPIKDAVYSGSITTITSVKLVKVNRMTLNDGEETTLSNSIIKYEDGEFKIDYTVNLTDYMDNCLYYLHFTTAENQYKSEIFLSQKLDIPLTADSTLWTADSTLITADQTKIEQ